MPPEDNSLPRLFFVFTSIEEYEENKNKLNSKQFALVPSVGKMFNNGTNYSGIVEGLEQIPKISFLTKPGDSEYLDLYLRLYISEAIYREVMIPIVSLGAAGLMTSDNLKALNKVIEDRETDHVTLLNHTQSILDLNEAISHLSTDGSKALVKVTALETWKTTVFTPWKQEVDEYINDESGKGAKKSWVRENFAKKDHTHSQYAEITWVEDNFQPKGNYAAEDHTHSQYALKSALEALEERVQALEDAQSGS